MHGRHVWVRKPHVPVDYPDLLVEWRKDAEGLHGLVTYVGPTPPRMVTGWLPASWLRSAGTAPRVGSAYG